MHSIEILRLFWHGRNISFKVFRKAILRAEIVETPFDFRRLHPGSRKGRLQRSPKLRSSSGGARYPSPRTPPRSSPLGLDFRPLGTFWPLPQNFQDPTLNVIYDKRLCVTYELHNR